MGCFAEFGLVIFNSDFDFFFILTSADLAGSFLFVGPSTF